MSQENSQPDTNSAQDATETESQPLPDSLYSLYLDEQQQDTVIKCTPCDTRTIHTWTNVMPLQENLMPLMPNIRRIIMCTHCGTISVKK
jgi:hypothetical protein